MSDPFERRLPDENELENLIEDLPSLLAVRTFASNLGIVPWFKNVAEPIEPELETSARRYLDALGFPDVEIAPVGDWETAASTAESLDWNSEAWQAEEQLRAALVEEALSRLNEDALVVALNHVAAKAGDVLEGLTGELQYLWDIEDTELVNAAAGAAAQVCHQKALVIASETEEDHPFNHKFALFEFGRWPISIAGQSLNLF